MSRRSKPKTVITEGERDSLSIYAAPEGCHPAQVSGLFQDDPSFEEFREILRQQHEEDYRRVNGNRDFTQVPNLPVEDWTVADLW